MEKRSALRSRLDEAYRILGPLWPEAVPLLAYRSPFELLCAVLLSAQCTDEQVNRITPGLFARWPDAAALAGAGQAELEEAVHSAGFFRTKAAHLIASSRILVERYGGEVPDSMEKLLELPGVGRKTANLVLSACFGQPGIIVDTHVLRVCLRLGIHDRKDPAAIEARIAQLVRPERRTRLSHALNRHGKYVCLARKPACLPLSGLAPCPIREICPRIGLEAPPQRYSPSK
jgi:endonuclease-3